MSWRNNAIFFRKIYCYNVKCNIVEQFFDLNVVLKYTYVLYSNREFYDFIFLHYMSIILLERIIRRFNSHLSE